MPGGNSRSTIFRAPHPPYLVSGRGTRLWDVDGDERIDFLFNYTSLIHGHAHPAVVRAATVAMSAGTAFSFPTKLEVELASRLKARLPSLERVRFTNSGSEAVMMAIRVARAATGRDRIAKFEGCYHGSYDDVQVSEDARIHELGPLEHPRSVSARGLRAGSPQAVLTLPYNRPDIAVERIEEAAEDLAAVIVDPAPNRAGLTEATPEFAQALRAVTSKHGIVLIFDEVITFRVGPTGMQGRLGVRPDLTTLGKIIGGGFPVGLVGGTADIMDEFDPRRPNAVAHGGTFSANPVTMGAGIATLDLLTDATYDRLSELTATLGRQVETTLSRAGRPCWVNVVGSLFQVQFGSARAKDYRGVEGATGNRQASLDFSAALLKRGMVLSPNGLGCVSTATTEQDLEEFIVAAVAASDELR